MTDEEERRYLKGRLVAHVLKQPLGECPMAYCGVQPWFSEDWWGTGSWEESQKAAALPVCKRCARSVAS